MGPDLARHEQERRRGAGDGFGRRSIFLGLVGLVGFAPIAGSASEAHGASLRLNESGYQYAVRLIEQGKVALDGRGDWGRSRPTPDEQESFVGLHGYPEFGDWFLAVNDAFGDRNRRHYAFPYGDFRVVRRSALLAAQARARQWGHVEVLQAAERLLSLLPARAPG